MEASEPIADLEAVEENLAVVYEVLPSTLRSLYVLRISLYGLVACLALGKVLLLPSVSSFFLDLITDTAAGRAILAGWVQALVVIVSGMLAASLSLAIATFFIQARLLGQAREEPAPAEKSVRTLKGLALVLGTLEREAGVALLTGMMTFGISELFARGANEMAAAFGLLAAVAAGGLDTLYVHLLFLLREAPVHASEKRYRFGVEQARIRLAEGSMRLPEALIGRFEADYRRTAIANRAAGGSRRQMHEARRQLNARLWVIERVVPRNQLAAFAAQARTDPDLLDRWMEEVDLLVSARGEVRRRQGILSRAANFLRPAELVRLTLAERHSFGSTT